MLTADLPSPSQTPVVETHLTDLLQSLPAQFTNPTTYEAAVTNRNELTAFAASQVATLKETDPDGEAWDWAGRVDVVDGDEEEGSDEDGEDKKGGLWGDDDDGDATMEEGAEAAKPAAPAAHRWTPREVATYTRTGRLPATLAT